MEIESQPTSQIRHEVSAYVYRTGAALLLAAGIYGAGETSVAFASPSAGSSASENIDNQTYAVHTSRHPVPPPAVSLPGKGVGAETLPAESHLPATPSQASDHPASAIPSLPRTHRAPVLPPAVTLPAAIDTHPASQGDTQPKNGGRSAPTPTPPLPDTHRQPQAPPVVSLPGTTKTDPVSGGDHQPDPTKQSPATPPATPAPRTPESPTPGSETTGDTNGQNGPQPDPKGTDPTTSPPPEPKAEPTPAPNSQPPASTPVPPAPADKWITPINLSVPGVRCGSGYKTPDRPDHLGQDIPAPEGTPVVSPFPGKVKRAGKSTGYGDAVVIYNPESKLYVELGHVQGPSISVHEGDTVQTGQQVALSGNEGQSTGPHLHVGVDTGFFTGRIDPNAAFKDHGGNLCG